MARVLELIDLGEDEDVTVGDTATLDQNGKVTYKGTGVQNIIAKFLVNHDGDEVFDKMNGWSNGYIALRERE